MRKVTLGLSGLEVSPIAFGTWQLGGDWGAFDEREAINAIRFARAEGINFFDTAQAYGFGVSERILGRALRDDLARRRDQIVIATKGGLRIDADRGLVRDSSRAWLRTGVEQSLKALEVDYIDLYQIHWPDGETPLAETGEALQELVNEGKIRHVGVSNFDPAEMAELARIVPVETLQPPYSMFRRGIEQEILPYAHQHNVGVLVYGPLAHGLLTGAIGRDATFTADDWRSANPIFAGAALERYLDVVAELERFAQARYHSVSQLAIAWTLRHPAVQVAIVGSRHQRHIAESIRALDLQLSDEELAEIDRILNAAGAVAIGGPTPEAMP